MPIAMNAMHQAHKEKKKIFSERFPVKHKTKEKPLLTVKGLLFYIIEIERNTLLSASVLVKSSFILCVLCGLNRIFDLFDLFG